MTRYVLPEGPQQRFWEVECRGATVTLRWGLGAQEEGQARQAYAKESEAMSAMLRELAERATAGYRLSETDAQGAPVLRWPTAPRVEALEQAIERDPDAAEPWRVYADWLQQHGDPRGELAALQHRGATRAQVEAYLSAHAPALLGPLAPVWELGGLKLQWRFGFIRAATVLGAGRDGLQVFELVRLLLALPAARFIETLELAHLLVEWGFAPLMASGRAERLKRLVLSGQSWSTTVLQPVLDTCVRLDQLVTRHLGLTGVRHGRLRVLSLTYPLGRGAEDTLGRSQLPQLRRLGLLPTGQCPLALVLKGRFPSLEVLSLVGDRYGPRLLEELERAQVLRQLKELRFSHPSPAVLTALVDLVPHWPWLSRVEVAARLTPARRAALARLKNVELRGRASPLRVPAPVG